MITEDGDVTDADAVIALFKEAGAYLEGHFKLSSGLHSSIYLQCARILKNPKTAERLMWAVAEKIKEAEIGPIDLVVSPAMGGIIAGYELARVLGVDEIFTERVHNEMTFRRGFEMPVGARVFMMEDVVTTGLSSKECIRAIVDAGGQVVGAGCLIDRTGGRVDLGVPFVSLASVDAPLYKADCLPQDLMRLPAVKPGSRVFKSD